MSDALIEVSGVSKTFRTEVKEPGFAASIRSLYRRRVREVHALDGVDMTVREGEVVGLLGANGAGKTTLLKILAGIIRPTAGNVRVLGYDPWQRDDRMRVALEWGGVESLVDPEAPSFAAYQRAVGALRELGTSALKRGQADRSVRSDVPLEHLAACLSGALQGVLQMEMRAEEVRRRLQLPAAPAVDFVNVLTQLVRAC